jgi:hypothetical protein
MPSILWSIEGLSGQVKGVKLPATVQLQDPDAYHPPPPHPADICIQTFSWFTGTVA